MTATLSGSDVNTADAALDLGSTKAAIKQHDAMVSWAKSQYKAIRNARVPIERQWYINLAFFFGKQNVAILRPDAGTGASTKLWTPPAPYYRARPVINLIRPTIRHEIAALTNNKPTASIVPASAEDRDMYAAMAGEAVWENLYIEHKLKFLIRQAVWWNQVCGNGFIKTWWDASGGPKDETTGAPLGDVCYASETPFHVLVPDFLEQEIENQPFLIHAQTKSPEWVAMNFPEAMDGTKIAGGGTADANDVLEPSYLNLTAGSSQNNKQQSVLVLEVWVKPGQHKMFPEGAFFTVIGDKIVQAFGELPYKHGKYPFAKLDHIPSGKFYSDSSSVDLIPLQREYNRTRGQIIEAKNRMAKPQLSAARGSVDPSKITSEPGLVVLYTPGMDPPKPIPLTPLPSYVLEEQDRIKKDWEDIAGQHDVSKGGAPPGVTAATAISYLQERDESNLSPTFDSLEECIEKTARLSLALVKDYWTTERLIRVTGDNGSFDVMTFKGSDLGDNTDLRIEAGSALPVSKAAKQALIMDLMKMGFISPEKGLEVMDMGGINKIYEQIQTDQRQAQRENLRMSKATPETLAEYAASFQPEVDPMADVTQLGAPMDPNSMDPMQPGMQPNGLPDPNALQQSPEMDPMAAMMGQPPAPAPMPPFPLIVPVNTWDNHKIHIEYHNQFRKGQAFENLPEETKALFEQHVMQHVMAIGIEQQTMNPSVAAGLPPQMGPDGMPMPPGGGEGGEMIDQNIAKGGDGQPPMPPGQGQPGPNPMPQLQSGGPQ